VGSSHNRLTSAEDNEEASLLGWPAQRSFGRERYRAVGRKEKKALYPYIPGLKRRGFTARMVSNY
jgi:hypothetical protein